MNFDKMTKVLCCAPPRCCVEFTVVNKNATDEEDYVKLANNTGTITIVKGDVILLANELNMLLKDNNNA